MITSSEFLKVFIDICFKHAVYQSVKTLTFIEKTSRHQGRCRQSGFKL